MARATGKFRALWFFLRQRPLLYGGLVAITLAYAVLESISVSMFFPLLSAALGEAEPTSPMPVFRVLERAVAVMPFQDPFVAACVLAVVVLLVKEGVGFARETLIGYGAGRLECDVKEAVFDKYAETDYTFFLDHRQGDLVYQGLI